MSAASAICDDCRKSYVGPAYYKLDPRTCPANDPANDGLPHAGCTGNLCPDCAGPFLVPDDPNDSRRPLAENEHARAAMDALIAHAAGR